MRKKRDMPTKTCVTFGRPFTWRRRWHSCWPDVQRDVAANVQAGPQVHERVKTMTTLHVGFIATPRPTASK